MTSPVGAATELREVTWRDIPQLVKHDAELFADDAWSEGTWWSELAARPRRMYVVAEREGDLIGYAGLNHGGSTADVMTIAVTAAARGCGVGRLLLESLIEAARSGGAESLMLEVRADNEPALTLYGRLGFDRLTIRRRYYQPGDIDAVIMRKLLEKP